MTAEIAEQPATLARLLDEGAAAVRDVARRVAVRRPRFVLLTARGTSDHAALYAKYLLEIRAGLPCGLTSMSTTTVHGARPDLTDCLVIAVSQSGGSPDLVASTAAAREAGAVTVAVTNDAGSSLAVAADHHVDVMAGPESAVPATKTYTAQLLTLHLFVTALAGLRPPPRLDALPELAAEVLAKTGDARDLADRYRFADRVVVTSRGYGYPTAREAALKLMETSYLPALAYSGADLLHGPLAMVDGASPVIAVVPRGPAGRALRPVLARLADRGADVTVIGDRGPAPRATAGFNLPDEELPEELQPLLQILPLQVIACHISVARGHDPDLPRALTKITETR